MGHAGSVANFNVERFVALTFGLATVGAIGAAVWTASQDDDVEGEEGRASPEAPQASEPEPPAPLATPDVGTATPTPAEESVPDDAQPADPAPPHPAVETPSWE